MNIFSFKMSNICKEAAGLKQELHPNIHYLMQDDIGKILSHALGELYLASPEKPIYFLGNWLLNYSATKKSQKELKAKEAIKSQLREKEFLRQSELAEFEVKQTAKLNAKKKAELSFKKKVAESMDVDDLLNHFCIHLQKNTLATGVYIARLETKPGADEAEDKEYLRYIAATKGHKFMINKILTPSQGPITFSAWGPFETAEEEEPKSEQSVFIKEVVNEPRMKYFDVPRLGCYLAIPMTYKSCLFQQSFDAAVDDYLAAVQRKEEQEDPVPLNPYETKELKYVVCLDTLGQDREFPDDMVEYAKKWVQRYQKYWERCEAENLKRDVDGYCSLYLKEQHQNKNGWPEEEKVAVDDLNKHMDPTFNDTQKEMARNNTVLNIWRRRALYKLEDVLSFKLRRIVKYEKVWEGILISFGVRRENLLEEGTLKFDWKKAREYLTINFSIYIEFLHPQGPKPHPVPDYAKIPSILSLLESASDEELHKYSFSISILKTFLVNYFNLRLQDINYRRQVYKNYVEALAAAEIHNRE